VICCGYKGYVIKEYFANYFLHTSDVTFDMADNSMEVHARKAEPWRVTLVDTGDSTSTGGRLKRVAPYLEGQSFCFTYGDGVADIDITALIAHHRREARWATLTAVQPPGRFGSLAFERGRVLAFEEKPQGDGSWINGGFFVLEPEVLSTIEGDDSVWERDCLPLIAATGQLNAYEHQGFWQPMDTLRDKQLLDELWQQGRAPWKTW
jgi:glucose-1-phosphate cytidylyltransferase